MRRISVFILLLLTPILVFAKTLTIGVVSDNPSSAIKHYLPLGKYLVKYLKWEGYTKVEIKTVNSTGQMRGLIRQSKVDIVFDNPVSMLRICRPEHCRIFLKQWKNGVSNYQSIIFSSRESGIDKLSDLQGKLIAFKSKDASAAYYIPFQSLQSQHFNVTENDTTTQQQFNHNIRYIFSDSDENTVLWVLRDKVAAGAINLIEYQRYLSRNPQLKQQLRIIYTSKPIPRALVSYRTTLDPQIVKRLTMILSNMNKDSQGIKILRQLENTSKFTLYSNSNFSHEWPNQPS